MKKFLFTLVLSILFSAPIVFSQCPNNISFYSQADIDNFPINYPNCTEIEGFVQINGEDITNLYGLSNIESVGQDLIINNNPLLTSLEGLENLISVDDFFLDISYNDALINLSGLNNLTSVFLLNISNNNSLTSLYGIENLTIIEQGLSIHRNNALLDMSGLENIIYIKGGVTISENNGLSNLDGINQLDSIGGSLTLKKNFFLQDISALSNLTKIGTHLIINKCNDLTNLTGLENLISIGGRLDIYENNDLESLEGIDNIASQSISNLKITVNPVLSICEVNSICEYLFNPNGDIEVHTNSDGCNNSAEIEYECTVSVGEILPSDQLTLYPNPFSKSTNIEYILEQPSTVQIIIYNHFGEQVEVIQQQQCSGLQKVTWNAIGQPSGVYYFRLQVGDNMTSGKMVLVK
ncbi:MAG: T9SS type A sorting domain-containing protein [Pseudomonadota bacterium]